MEEFAIQATVNGRSLLRQPLHPLMPALLAGFHGYGQSAEEQLSLLASIPGSEHFTLCSIEALHQFYNVNGKPGASWMTSSQRKARIEENVLYVDAVIGKVLQRGSTLVFHGFSQGAGMASRAALLGKHRASGLMLLGGDFPPELEAAGDLPVVHIARGGRDPVYREEHFMKDCRRFGEGGVHYVPCSFKGGHEAADEYLRSAGEFLQQFLRNSS